MGGLLGTLSIGMRSLQNQTQALYVVGHNISNVNNPAYARQRIQFQTAPPIMIPAGYIGTGCDVAAIVQLRNALLDKQIINEQSNLGFWETYYNNSSFIETAIGQVISRNSNTSDINAGQTSLAAAINDLFNAFQSVATSPESLEERMSLLEKANRLAELFNIIDSRIQAHSGYLKEEFQVQVGKVNELLEQIAKLNYQISAAELGGRGMANDLRDIRQEKLEELSKYIGINLGEDEQGNLTVSIGSQILISGNNLENKLQIVYDAEGRPLVEVSSGQVINPESGSLAGLLNFQDNVLNVLKERLDNLASAIVEAINSIHQQGYSLDGETSRPLFLGSNAATIRVNPEIMANPRLFQASGFPDQAGDNSIALTLAQLISKPIPQLDGQTIQSAYTGLISWLGQTVANASSNYNDQRSIMEMLKRQRESISGVSIDEEVVDMMKFQRAFEASARLISTIDEMLFTIINMKR